MEDIMIDLETLDIRASAVVVSCGAVKFSRDTGELGEELYLRLCIDGQLALGRTISERTLMWWMSQSEESRAVFQDEPLPCIQAVLKIAEFIGADACIWGNGAEFDNAILSSLFASHNLDTPWKFWNGRCYRTLKNMYPDIQAPVVGIAHNASGLPPGFSILITDLRSDGGVGGVGGLGLRLGSSTTVRSLFVQLKGGRLLRMPLKMSSSTAMRMKRHQLRPTSQVA